jgi:hypothetical protein
MMRWAEHVACMGNETTWGELHVGGWMLKRILKKWHGGVGDMDWIHTAHDKDK